MHFLLSTMSMVYVLNTPIPNDEDDATVELIRRRNKWDNDDCVCHVIILNGMSEFCLIFTKMLNQKKNYGISWRPNMRMHHVKKFLDSDKPKSNNVDGPLVVNMVKHNNSIRAVVRLPDPKLKFFGERSIECIFVGYVEHSKAFKFYVIESNESVSIYSIIESRDAIFDENRFSSVSGPSQSKFDESGKGVIICLYVDDMLIFDTDQVQVDLTKEFLSSRFSMKDMGEADWLGIPAWWRCNFWASKKQTCIISSTIEYEFIALADAGKEAEWLRNLILEIPLRSKPMVHISIRYDSVATLAKAQSQMYYGKSRNLGIRHSMIRELIMKGVVSIEFVRSQKNLAGHLKKGLARDLVLKSAKGMGLKSNLVAEC
ncbi:zinc finger, CCHC-type containing protein [Tanacetum coccineum]